MKTKVSILFYAKRAKVNANGLYPIYTRITVNGKVKTHLADNLSTSELELHYGNRMRSRLREFF